MCFALFLLAVLIGMGGCYVYHDQVDAFVTKLKARFNK